jgi:hypothetical protein
MIIFQWKRSSLGNHTGKRGIGNRDLRFWVKPKRKKSRAKNAGNRRSESQSNGCRNLLKMDASMLRFGRKEIFWRKFPMSSVSIRGYERSHLAIQEVEGQETSPMLQTSWMASTD